MNSIATFRLGSLAREQVGERMLGVLAALLPISFIDEEAQGVDAAADVVIEGTSRIGGAGGKRVARFSAAAQTAFADNPRTGEQEVVFCDDPLVPFPFRGRTVRTRLSANCRPLALRSGDRPLAITLDGPIWSACSDGPVEHFRSALCLPRLSDEQSFVDVFNGACFLRTLVMLQFLEHVCANETYRHAPLRAAFIVDDPNLHWPRYGFVDYRAMAARAARENYHVSFAMIPMDTWFTHRPTAALLRECGQRLSLVFHGNNHAREEMARDYPDAVRTALLRSRSGGSGGRPRSLRRRRPSVAAPTTAVEQIRGAGRTCPHRLWPQGDEGEVGAGAGGGSPLLTSWCQGSQLASERCWRPRPPWP